MLRTADLKPVYATGENEPIEFYLECLFNSLHFDIGLGFFSSSAINTLAIGFAYFLKRGGTVRILVNDFLSSKDKTAILEGQSGRQIEIENAVVEDVLKLKETLSKADAHFFKCLSWLIANDRLQIKALVPKHNKPGIVHQKFGVFADVANDKVVFTGSTNLSKTALQYNVEDLCCDFSWNESSFIEERIRTFESIFDKAWRGVSSVVDTIPIEKVKLSINELYPFTSIETLLQEEQELARELYDDPDISEGLKEKIRKLIPELGEPKTNNNLSAREAEKWRHQKEATELFLSNEQGILNMATGTGKTRTALGICVSLHQSKAIDTIVVSCDGTDLLIQWYKELLAMVRKHFPGWIIYRHYSDYHESDKYRTNPVKKILLTSRLNLHLGLFGMEETIASRALLIHDEVHKLGSSGNRERLDGKADHIRYRLGLSATPEREYDEEGTQFILSHIGPVLFEFSLEDAIARGILAPFNYFPLPYALTQDDKTRLRALMGRKAASEKAGNPMSDEEFWIEISKVYKTSEGKIPVFYDFIRSNPQILESCIIFVETKEYGIDILNLVHEFSTDFHTYFGEDDSEELERFARGEITCLLTCHRLSEGIDIRSLKNVILLASARAKLETIQRIGRCLRSDPDNPGKIANVVDFIRLQEKEEETLPNADEERQEFLMNLSLIRPA